MPTSEYQCEQCREWFAKSELHSSEERILCHTCWPRSVSPADRLAQFDRDAKAQLERDLRRADPPRETPDPRREDPPRETPDPRRADPAFGGRAAEVAKKRCAPSPFVEDAVEAGAVMGLEDAVAAAAKTMAAHRQAMAEREQEIQRRMAAKRYAEKDRDAFVLTGDGTDGPGIISEDHEVARAEAAWDAQSPPPVTRLGDDPYTTLRRERERAGDFIRPASFAAEQERPQFEFEPEDLRPETDPVSRPAHYNQGDIECLDAMVAAFGEDAVRTYARVNAFKYLWRSEYKGGDEDLRKAVFYLRRARGEDPR